MDKTLTPEERKKRQEAERQRSNASVTSSYRLKPPTVFVKQTKVNAEPAEVIDLASRRKKQ